VFVHLHCHSHYSFLRGVAPPEEIIAELYQAVLAFATGTKQKDDLTAVIIKRISAQKTTQ